MVFVWFQNSQVKVGREEIVAETFTLSFSYVVHLFQLYELSEKQKQIYTCQSMVASKSLFLSL